MNRFREKYITPARRIRSLLCLNLSHTCATIYMYRAKLIYQSSVRTMPHRQHLVYCYLLLKRGRRIRLVDPATDYRKPDAIRRIGRKEHHEKKKRRIPLRIRGAGFFRP